MPTNRHFALRGHSFASHGNTSIEDDADLQAGELLVWDAVNNQWVNQAQSGTAVRIYDAGGTDYVNQSHDVHPVLLVHGNAADISALCQLDEIGHFGRSRRANGLGDWDHRFGDRRAAHGHDICHHVVLMGRQHAFRGAFRKEQAQAAPRKSGNS